MLWTPAATIDDLDDQIAKFLYVVWTPTATIDDLDDQIAEFLYEVWTPAATIDDLDDQIAEFLYVVWTPAATIDVLDDQIAEFLCGCSGHSASLNIPSSSAWCPVFVQVISHLPDKQRATNFSTCAMTSTRPS